MQKEGNVLFNDALNTFYLVIWMEGRKEMFYLTMHSTHFIYGYTEGMKEMFYLTRHSSHFIYGYTEGRNFFIERHTQHILFTVIWRTYGKEQLR